jgi:hypothetical protein
MKTTRPDPQTCHACSAPAIRDDKVNHQALTVASEFFSKLLVVDGGYLASPDADLVATYRNVITPNPEGVG